MRNKNCTFTNISICLCIILSLFFLACSSPTKSNNSGNETNTVTDIDANVYETVKIGGQWWMAENLKVTKYRSGEAIPNVMDNSEWLYLNSGAYCCYNNENDNIGTHGLLYNWYVVNDSRKLAPEGWHLPSDEEWKTLEMYLGMSQAEADKWGTLGRDSGSKIKSKSGWPSDCNGTNESGFSALPGGYRLSEDFHHMVDIAAFWSATEVDSYSAWGRMLGDSEDITRNWFDNRYGFSIRCIRD